MKCFVLVGAYVVLGTLACVGWHAAMLGGTFNGLQATLAFFLVVNLLVCFWEICLGLEIEHIARRSAEQRDMYKGRAMDAAVAFFLRDIDCSSVKEVASTKLWSEVWSTYSVFDISYAQRTSFGFFVDVGNGWSTIVPCMWFLLSMTLQGSLGGARLVGIVGLVSFYQMLYGTVIYFSSFIFNRRYRGLTPTEIALFVGCTNGLWFALPLLGMHASVQMIFLDSFAAFGGQA